MRRASLIVVLFLLFLFHNVDALVFRMTTAAKGAEEQQADKAASASAGPSKAEIDRSVERGLNWLAGQQTRLGCWYGPNKRYAAAMTGMAGIAFCCEGSTTTQGKYSQQIRRAVDFLTAQSNPNGLIGAPHDDRYIYGHGFAMLFLSQVLGEEEDADRRAVLIDVLERAVSFSSAAQTQAGGWGYVSAKEGSDFDEGSTTITQVQGLRGCRNAGIVVPKEIIERAVGYIHRCTGPDGGVQYNIKGGGGRPAITAAAIACLFNAGEYDDKMKFCQKNLDNLSGNSMGYWHYAHYYYSQVKYRDEDASWKLYRNLISKRILSEAQSGGYWEEGYNGAVYTTSINLTILQLEKGLLPIYQR